MRDLDLLRRFPASALAGALLACTPGTPAPSVQSAAPAPSAASTEAVAAHDPYHPPPHDTVEVSLYKAWQQYSLQCARCHGEDGQGTSFAPSLLVALGPEGLAPTREDFMDILGGSREDKGMPSGATMGIDTVFFDGLYRYLKGRSDGRLHGGRPARRES